MNLGISTSWNAALHTDSNKLIQEVKSLGFDEVELSFNLTAFMVEAVGKLVEENQIKVVSLHNFCPIPEGLKREEALPDCFSLASPDETIRQKAVGFTKRTIDTAAELNARAVVLHCGRVEVASRTVELIALYERGLKDTSAFSQIREKIIAERRQNAKPYFESSLKSLDELNTHARVRNILLGIETRFYYREIPSVDEIGIILEAFKNSQIHYWHDTGHAQLMENLGFCSRDEYINRYGKAMIGVHAHNIIGCYDHQAPVRGEFDFNRITPYIKSDTIAIIEAHQPASGQELRESKEYLERLWNGRGTGS
jgi:sugar phosphate isomerase/epimerase